jgi:hypothetical protein
MSNNAINLAKYNKKVSDILDASVFMTINVAKSLKNIPPIQKFQKVWKNHAEGILGFQQDETVMRRARLFICLQENTLAKLDAFTACILTNVMQNNVELFSNEKAYDRLVECYKNCLEKRGEPEPLLKSLSRDQKEYLKQMPEVKPRGYSSEIWDEFRIGYHFYRRVNFRVHGDAPCRKHFGTNRSRVF